MPLLTQFTKPSGCVVLTIDTHTSSPKGARAGVTVQGLIVDTTVCMLITLTLDAWEGINYVATLKWFVVVQWLATIALQQNSYIQTFNVITMYLINFFLYCSYKFIPLQFVSTFLAT